MAVWTLNCVWNDEGIGHGRFCSAAQKGRWLWGSHISAIAQSGWLHKTLQCNAALYCMYIVLYVVQCTLTGDKGHQTSAIGPFRSLHCMLYNIHSMCHIQRTLIWEHIGIVMRVAQALSVARCCIWDLESLS